MVESILLRSDSLLSGAVTTLGERGVQYSHWNGFDLTTKAGTDKLKEDLVEKKPRVVWMTPPCTMQRTQQSVKIKISSNTHKHPGCVSLACETRLVPSDSGTDVGSTSLGRGGAFSELKEQFHSGRTPGCQWDNLADGTLS